MAAVVVVCFVFFNEMNAKWNFSLFLFYCCRAWLFPVQRERASAVAKIHWDANLLQWSFFFFFKWKKRQLGWKRKIILRWRQSCQHKSDIVAESDQALDKSRPVAESLWMELRSKRQTKCHYCQPACATLKLFIFYLFYFRKKYFLEYEGINLLF